MLGLVVAAALAAAAQVPAFLELVVNTVPRSSVYVLLDGDDIWVERQALIDGGLDVDRVSYKRDAAGRISLASLAPSITFVMDDASLELRLTAAPELLPRQVIDLRVKPDGGIDFHKDASAFLNYSARLSDLQYFTGATELGLSLYGVLAYTSVQIESTTWKPVRGLSNVTIDEPTKLQRWIVGDNFVSSGALGGGVFLGGLSVGRSFDTDPYTVRRPMLGYTGAAATPSMMEVYVNDVLVRREAVAPGLFEVKNLPGTIGQGNYRYVLRDAFGRASAVQSPFYLAREVLPYQLSDYSVAVGFERRHLATESFDYKRLSYLGAYRRGFTEWLTAGGRVEGQMDVASAGTTFAFGLPSGELSVNGAGSFDRGRFGAAGQLSYAFLSRWFSTSVFARALTDHYANLSLRADVNRAILDAGVTASVPIARYQLACSAGYAVSAMRDTGTRHTVASTFFARITSMLNFNATGTVTFSRAPVDYSLFANLSVVLDARTVASLAYSQTPTTHEVQAAVSRSAPLGTGVGLQAFGAYNAEGHSRVSALMQYQSPYGVHLASNEFRDGQNHPVFETRGGVSYVDGGGLFASRPVQAGYASVTVPGVRGVRVYLNHQEVGRTNAAGQVLVPGLLPYYGNRISIADTDVPLDYRIDVVEQTVAGGPGAGINVVFPAARVHLFRGVARVAGEAARDGELTLTDRAGRSTAVPLGRDGRYELDGFAAGVYGATIDWQGGKCKTTLELPASDELIVDKGVLACTP